MIPTRQTQARPANALTALFLLALWLGQAQAQDAKPGMPAAKPAPAAANSDLPALFLIGDSTVKNGTKGQTGWGEVVGEFFDRGKINVVNRALGGRSSRTFLTEGLWGRVLADLKPGDFVLMQFGHNDGGELAKGSRPRASLKGNGDESKEVVIETTGKTEVVHSYGWYLRKYIADAKAKGATPIVLSPVPRKIWKEGKIIRAASDYGRWAAEAAQAGGSAFVDLNEIVDRRYDEFGPEKVETLFADEHTHTSMAGAELNAASVAWGLRQLQDCPLGKFLSGKAEVAEKAALKP